MKLYDKRDDFNFPIVNFPFICSNIPGAPAYGLYISQLLQDSRSCGSYYDFLDRGLLLTRKLLKHEFLWISWSNHFKSFMVATMTWLTVTEYLCHKWPRICSVCRNHNHDSCHMWSRNCLHFGSTWIHPWFLVGFVLLSLQYCRSLFVLFRLPISLSILFSIYDFWLSLWYLQTKLTN